MPEPEQAANAYSPIWFELFLTSIQPAQTETEIAFISRYLPLPAYRTVLDLCCGVGRHALRLAEQGYQVTGVDRDPAILDKARKLSNGKVTYLQRDMRYLADLPGSFDAVVSLWQSFGYFDEATNIELLRQIHRKLTARGRLILDVYNRSFFEQHQWTRQYEKEGLMITSTQYLTGNRLTVRLDYGVDDQFDHFEWHLYTPAEIRNLGQRLGFSCLVSCSGFDEKELASAGSPRMQIVLQKY